MVDTFSYTAWNGPTIYNMKATKPQELKPIGGFVDSDVSIDDMAVQALKTLLPKGTPVINTIRKKVPKLKRYDVFYNRNILELVGKGVKKYPGQIGLEIECEGTNLYTTPMRWWGTHVDPSLRPCKGHDPVEYTLKEPLSREDVTKALKYLEKGLKASAAEPDLSYRTSVHVHLNVQNLTLKQILTFVSLYILFENVLTKFCGPTREGNLFCLRAPDAGYWLYSINKMLVDQSLGSLCNDSNRYVACNLSSLTKFGSVEFRALRGTIDREVIEAWVDILLAILDFSKTIKDPYHVYRLYRSTTPELLASSVLGHKLLSYLNGDVCESLRIGGRYVIDIAQAVPEWLEPKTKEELEANPITAQERLEQAYKYGSYVLNTSLEEGDVYFSGVPTGWKVKSKHSLWYDNDGPIAQTFTTDGEVDFWMGDEDAA